MYHLPRGIRVGRYGINPAGFGLVNVIIASARSAVRSEMSRTDGFTLLDPCPLGVCSSRVESLGSVSSVD